MHSSEQIPFDLRSLEIFLAVCDTRAMAAAARLLALTQPAVSTAIAELERRTSTLLFSRDVRPLALTPAGELLRQHAAVIVSDARRLPALLREARRHKAPAIRIGIVDSLNRALTGALARFLSERAHEVSILSGLTANHASDLLTRRLDFFLGVDDMRDQPGLERWQIATEPYVLLLPNRAQMPRTVADLKALAEASPMIRFSARSQTGIEVERHLRRLGIEPPRAIECDTPYAVARLVADNAGFAVTTPLCIAEAALPPRSFKMAALPGPKLSRHLTLVSRKGELGALPKDTAQCARETLETRVISRQRTKN